MQHLEPSDRDWVRVVGSYQIRVGDDSTPRDVLAGLEGLDSHLRPEGFVSSDIQLTGRRISVAFIVLGAVVVPRFVETLAHGRASLLDWLPVAVWIAVTVAFFDRGRGLAGVTLAGDTLSVVRSEGVERIPISSVRRIELGAWYDRPRTIRL